MNSRVRVHRPETVTDAVDLVQRYDDAALLAGGTELLLLMRLGLTQIEHLVSLRRLPGMTDLTLARSGDLVLGAGVTHQQVADSHLVREHNSAFARAEGRLANLRVRTSGTLAGNLAFADPHSDTLPLLMALNASIACAGPAGRRQVAVGEFVCGPFTTILEPGEVITEIVVPSAAFTGPLAHERFESSRQRPMVTVSCSGRSDGFGRFAEAFLVVGSVCPRPVVVSLAEHVGGRRPDELGPGASATAVAEAVDGLPLRDDEDGAADYKSALVTALSSRAWQGMVASATRRNAERIPW